MNGSTSFATLREASQGSGELRALEAATGLTEAGYQAPSPALTASAGLEAPAYELKFLLTEAQAAAVELRARDKMVSDPHADPTGANYRTTSIYCDTAQLDVYHRRGLYKRRKHRLRRYGRAPWVFLERKTKWGDRVKKLRTPIRDGELPILAL